MNYVRYILAGVTCVVLMGLASCVCKQYDVNRAGLQLLEENLDAGHHLALLFEINSGKYESPDYPKTLEELRSELRSSGIKPDIPQCRCLDGKTRDFDYISGLGTADGPNFVFLVSPKEMGTNLIVIVYLDGKAVALNSKRASEEIDISRNWVKHKLGEIQH